jgi:hypothetical protein
MLIQQKFIYAVGYPQSSVRKPGNGVRCCGTVPAKGLGTPAATKMKIYNASSRINQIS